MMPPPSSRPKTRKHPMSRREALLWIGTLTAGGGTALCGVGGLIALLIGRKNQEAVRLQTTLAAIAMTPPGTTLTPPVIIPRDQWGARTVNHQASNESGFAPANPLGWLEYQGDLAAVYSTVAIHHSYPVRRDTGTMRELQDIHMDGQGWADIGYHFGVGGDGKVYAGRDIRARGSNVAGHNTGVIGVVAIGDFESEVPALAQLNALQNLILWLRAQYTLTHIAGHYEFNPDTQCPGKYLRLQLDTLAYNCGLTRGTGGYIPPTPISLLTGRGCCP
ncbi:hypothetical protein ANRL4_00741 [Anaerolineae bacterium]|nr:hypothetical protein ANRL4_00741 [Anaerolineae bacterium]